MVQFFIRFVTVAFVSHLGGLELAAVAVVQNVIEGFVYGIMLGMGSALETPCGQAVGARQLNMLGIYMQRSFIITIITPLLLTPVYVFTSPFLKLLHQTLAFHVLLSWALVTKVSYGLHGATIAGNISWWLVVLAQMVYVVSGFFPESWTCFSSLAFKSLASFVKISLVSAIMLCLELWYYTVVILMVGWLKNPEIAIDAISICMNFQLWTLMIALGFNAAVSVRVSNELGPGCPKAAKLSIVVTALTSATFGVLFTAVILVAKNNFPKLFTTKRLVLEKTSKLGSLVNSYLCFIIESLHFAVSKGSQ
ncbi:hypothetical protein ACSBR2_033534 [Camellia fascicularis]